MAVHHGNMPALFRGHPSRIYDFMARHVFRRLYRRLAHDIAASAPQGAAVLDVGTGPGMLLVELAQLRPDLTLTGVDLSADMVAAAERNLRRHHGRATMRCADVTNLPFTDGSFDLIVSSLSLHHWDNPEAAGVELARVLRPGGQVHIYDFRFAPFQALAGTGKVESTALRTGIPFFPRLFKYVVALQAAA